MIKIAAVTLLILSCTATLFAATAGWQRSIKVEWGYSAPEDVTVTEFRLYQNGKKVCTFPGGTAVVGECVVVLSKTASDFTLSAAFADGAESPKSAAYTFTDLGTGPAISKMSSK